MGILGAPTKFYPAYVSAGPWPSIYSKWSTSTLLSDPEFYRRMFMRFYHLLLLPAGFVGALVGALIWRGWGRLVLAVWLVSNVVFLFVAGEVHRVHEYYQLPVRRDRGYLFWGSRLARVRRRMAAETHRRRCLSPSLPQASC